LNLDIKGLIKGLSPLNDLIEILKKISNLLKGELYNDSVKILLILVYKIYLFKRN
jgi:hypothetical protein